MEAIRRVPTLTALLLLIALVTMVGCGSQTSASASTEQAPTATATTMAPLSPTPQPTVDPALITGCDDFLSHPDSISQSGDVLIDKPIKILDYSAVRLPDQTPLKPLQVGNQTAGGDFASADRVNPGTLTGSVRLFRVLASICNNSASTTHIVQSVSVRIDTLTPYSGLVNVWPVCELAFSRQNPDVHSAGCGGAARSDEQVQATFPSGAQAGVTVVATQADFGSQANPPSGLPPLRMIPGMRATFEVWISIPDMAGTYAFSVGFQVDRAPVAFGRSTDAINAAPVAHTFTGAACNTPAMLAQIPPATTPPTYYICSE